MLGRLGIHRVACGGRPRSFGPSRLQRRPCSWFVSYWLIPQESWLPRRMRARYYIQPHRERTRVQTVCYLQYSVRPLKASNIDHFGIAFNSPRGRNSIQVELSHHTTSTSTVPSRAELIISRLTESTELTESKS